VSSPLQRVADRLSRHEGAGGWRSLARRGYHGTRGVADRLGIQVLVASYSSPIPRASDLPDDAFSRASEMRGIDWDPAAQLAWIERELGPLLPEFRPERGVDAPVGTFRLDNGTYESVDAELLRAMVRRFRPRLVVELGSGYSTLLIADALAANAAEGHAGEVRCFDPYPSAHVLARDDLRPAVRALSAQAVPDEAFADLRAGDVLFVDTSHTVKLGGDVNRIVLDVLPTLAPGVIVHFHDIFLPLNYSRGHFDNAQFWNEQYLVQAFLVGNQEWEVLIGAMAVSLAGPVRLRELIPSFRDGVAPGALWMRRREEQ
jgi:predicted O-methyltransferase YrrM